MKSDRVVTKTSLSGLDVGAGGALLYDTHENSADLRPHLEVGVPVFVETYGKGAKDDWHVFEMIVRPNLFAEPDFASRIKVGVGTDAFFPLPFEHYPDRGYLAPGIHARLSSDNLLPDGFSAEYGVSVLAGSIAAQNSSDLSLLGRVGAVSVFGNDGVNEKNIHPRAEMLLNVTIR